MRLGGFVEVRMHGQAHDFTGYTIPDWQARRSVGHGRLSIKRDRVMHSRGHAGSLEAFLHQVTPCDLNSELSPGTAVVCRHVGLGNANFAQQVRVTLGSLG